MNHKNLGCLMVVMIINSTSKLCITVVFNIFHTRKQIKSTRLSMVEHGLQTRSKLQMLGSGRLYIVLIYRK
jgi:hypothetical protein